MTSILTYHRKTAPYESSWLIVLKILLINDISIALLMELVLRRDVPAVESKFYWWESLQFNIPVLAYALGLSIETICNAFLDRLMDCPVSLGPKPIKHCGTCIEKFYHCSLYQLAWITHCPIHKTELVACKTCASFFKDQKLSNARQQIWTGLCPHLEAFTKFPFPANTLSDAELDVITAWGSSLAGWLIKARSITDEKMLSIIDSPLSAAQIEGHFIYFRYLETAVGQSPLVIPASDYQAQKISLRRLSNRRVPEPLNNDLDPVVCSKSLRRHFYKRYVKSHRRCVNEFKRLGVNHCYALVGVNRCSSSLAYFSWLVTFLNVYTLKDLTDRAINPYSPSRGLHANLDSTSVVGLLLEGWCAFHDIWGAFELYDQIHSAPCDLEVCIGLQRGAEHRVFRHSLRTFVSEDGSGDNHYHVAGGSLLQQSLVRCKGRSDKKMVPGTMRPEDSWGVVNTPRTTIFKLTHQSSYRGGRVMYLYI